jgi:cation diffusion facilitator family transporter
MGTHHHLPQATDDCADAQRVTYIGAGVNLFLSVLKIIVGTIGNSAALLADGVHSLSDLASDTLVLLATKHGAQPADDDHPYGHARFETAATVVLGVMLIIVAIGIAWDAIERSLAASDLATPSFLAIIVATISLASNEWLYQYTMAVAQRIHSKLLEANAWHHRSDAISSFVVLVGIAGAMVGFPVLDAIAAFIVALMIAHIAWQLISNSVKELVDTAVDDETQQEIINLITQTDGVVSLHMLRTRLMGAKILIDAHLQVQPRLSVSEGHQIAETVEYLLKNQVDHVRDVTIHIDPQDDELAPLNDHLPLRSRLLEQLEPQWSHIPASTEIKEIDLHYLDGKIEVGILMPLPEGGSEKAREIQTMFTELAENHELLSAIKVSFN